MALAIAAMWLLASCAAGLGAPADSSADAGFSRDMQVHHAQAVDMAMTLLESTDDPAMRTLAYDIATTQQQQIGQMYGWLRLWGLTQTGSDPPMAWMSAHGAHAGHDDAGASGGATPMPTLDANDLMPGMATPEQMNQLRAARGVAAERLFLTLMITHHQAGVEMAQAAVDLAEQPVVTELAGTMVAGQRNEITLMRALLAERQ